MSQPKEGEEEEHRNVGYLIENLPSEKTTKFEEFAINALKKVINPYSPNFKYVRMESTTTHENVTLQFYSELHERCLTRSNERILTTFEDCRLDILEKKFERNNTHLCSGEKCSIKLSFKTIIGEKQTNHRKVGAKFTVSAKGKIGIPFVAEGEIGAAVEVSFEYGQAYENSISRETLFETTVDMANNQIDVPTIVTGGNKCEVSIRRVNSRFGPTSHGSISGKLTPCNQQVYRWGYEGLPFNDLEVTIPLFDKNDEIIKIKYVHVHHIFRESK